MVYGKEHSGNLRDVVAPSIVARLEAGWRCDPERKGFVHEKSGDFFPVRGLPASTRVEPRFPSLAARRKSQLSKDELKMARYVQFVFHSRARPAKHLKRIASWEVVQDAYVAPLPELPDI